MAVKLHRCSNQWVKIKGHPCWRGREGAHGHGHRVRARPRPVYKAKREAVFEGTGQRLYPDIEFEDGTWYREQSKDMEATIRAGNLMEKAGG